ncbi:MAG TPA: lipopolysaccharide biosynthesis protein [Gaiellaceae bacterium]|nr:lipopolysaccharide biosynthesis protein [Gaiellaceae bacterium]
MEEKAIRGIPWTFLTLAGSRLVQIGGTVVLARLLEPEDFGLVALALTISILLGLVASLGLGGVFVVEQGLDERGKGTYLTLFLAMGAGFAVLMAALSPLAARIFAEPRLDEIVLAMSVMVFFSGGLNWFYEALLQRELEFRRRFVAQMVQAVTYAGTGVTLAALGAGVWSLVAAQIASAGCYAAALLALAPYRVRPAWDGPAALHGLRAGRGFLVQAVTSFAAQNVDIVVVGRVLGAARLGYYSLAVRLSELPNWFVAESVARVTFPGFARMRHRGEDVTPPFLTALQLVAFATCPLGIVLSGAAEPVTLVVFGERWAPMIGPLAVLGVWAAVKPVRNTTAWLLNSVGEQAVLGRISLALLVLLVPAVAVAARRGDIADVAWVVLAESVVATAALAWFARTRAGAGLGRQWRALRPVALACVPAWLATRLVVEATEGAAGAVFLVAPLTAGLAAYLAAILAADRGLPRHALAQARRMVSPATEPEPEAP